MDIPQTGEELRKCFNKGIVHAVRLGNRATDILITEKVKVLMLEDSFPSDPDSATNYNVLKEKGLLDNVWQLHFKEVDTEEEMGFVGEDGTVYSWDQI